MVVTDSLTGLHNRRFFEEIVAHELNLHRRYGTPLSLVFLDIDRFKSINDTLGHAAGDNTLREVAAFLTRQSAMRTTCSAGVATSSWSCSRAARRKRGGKDGSSRSEFSRSTTVAGLPEGVGLSFGCAEVSALCGIRD